MFGARGVAGDGSLCVCVFPTWALLDGVLAFSGVAWYPEHTLTCLSKQVHGTPPATATLKNHVELVVHLHCNSAESDTSSAKYGDTVEDSLGRVGPF